MASLNSRMTRVLEEIRDPFPARESYIFGTDWGGLLGRSAPAGVSPRERPFRPAEPAGGGAAPGAAGGCCTGYLPDLAPQGADLRLVREAQELAAASTGEDRGGNIKAEKD